MLGRWTTVDPIHAGLNWYVYVGNDPVNRIDPLGLLSAKPEVGRATEPKEIWEASFIEANVGFVTAPIVSGSGILMGSTFVHFSSICDQY